MKAKNDVSYLFSNLGQSGTSGIDLSQYAQIKNGTYGKLLKSYYNQQSEDKTKAENSSKKNSTDTLVDSTGLSQIKSDADNLKTTAEKLGKSDLWKKTDGQYDMDKISDSIKSFVTEYNDVISQSQKVTSNNIDTAVKYMTSMTGVMSNSLAKIGLTVEASGKLSFDADKFKSTDGSAAKSLFEGTSSYGSQIADKASEISRQAIMSSSTYSNTGTSSSSISGLFNQFV